MLSKAVLILHLKGADNVTKINKIIKPSDNVTPEGLNFLVTE